MFNQFKFISILFFSFLSWMQTEPVHSETRFQAIAGTKGMVVSDDENASAWGVEILRQGGNAIDAAVATAFYLSVSRPHYAALGGGGFLLYCPAPKPKKSACTVIDYREQAPLKAHSDFYMRNGKANTDLSQDGPLASGVPGVAAGLFLALEKFGTLKRQKILSKPIEVAKNGFRVTGYTENAIVERWEAFNPEAKKIFGCSGKPCSPGMLLKQPDLAKVLETLSQKGVQGFYKGWVAEKIEHGFQKAGGVITKEDLLQYQPKVREPVGWASQDYEIVSMPPPSAGGTLILQMFQYANQAQAQGAFQNGLNSAQSIHATTHAMSLAFSDRAYYFGDPDFVHVPLSNLLDPKYLSKRWESFSPRRANLPESHGEIKEGQNTTHFSIIDRHGNAVAITTTVNDHFGSGFVPPGTGIVMNDEMDDFSLDLGVPNMYGLVGQKANAIEPKKRPLSSMSPTIVRDPKGNAMVVIGAQGGPKITTSVFLSLWNHLYYKMSLADSVIAPRFHHQWSPKELMLEKDGFSYETKEALKNLGYTLKEVGTVGKIHALERLPSGRVLGVSDPRAEGAAVAE